VFKGTEELGSGEFERQRIESELPMPQPARTTPSTVTTAPKDFAALAPLQIDVVLTANPR